VFEDNRIWSNNFNVYGPKSDVKSATPVPIGTGMVIGGGDDDVFRNNQVWDNWKTGTMLITVPDVISCAPTDVGTPKCIPTSFRSTSNDNRYYDNLMSRTPDGKPSPNGVDFWWDEGFSTTGNCWYANQGRDGS